MRADRLLSIILILSKKAIVTGKELAKHFDVSVRTIYRDIDKISEAGIPVAAIGGKSGGFYIMENYKLDDLYFNKGELHTLMEVLNSLNIVFGNNHQFNDIVLKLQSIYENEKDKNNKLNIDMSHFSMESELKEFLYIINQGIEESRLLVFKYINRNLELAERNVEPTRIEFSYGQWYVTGYCRNRSDYRKFKLVRMKNLSLGDSFVKRDIMEEKLDEIFRRSDETNNVNVKLKFSSKIGEQLTEYFFKDNIKKDREGYFIVEEPFPYDEGLIKFILGFGCECEVIEPNYLREDTKKYLKRILENYND
ncbi:YafY family transcriptional regulator [Serpentinicella alkaliphila]|nr:YafY family transcriptional regulator [Serpentinicella alkaliphila]